MGFANAGATVLLWSAVLMVLLSLASHLYLYGGVEGLWTALGSTWGKGSSTNAGVQDGSRSAESEGGWAEALEQGHHGTEYVQPKDWFEAQKKEHGSYDAWYKGSVDFWDSQPATDGSVAGNPSVVQPDIDGSRDFLTQVLQAVLSSAQQDQRRLVAADCAAGVGRVTRHLLQYYFHEIDLIEPAKNLISEAERLLHPQSEEQQNRPSRVADTFHYHHLPLQGFVMEQARYDVIWVQWCFMHMVDEHIVDFLRRAHDALKPGGLILLKENLSEDRESWVDKSDNSIMRDGPQFQQLFEEGGMRVVSTTLQRFSSDLMPVRMWALQPTAA